MEVRLHEITVTCRGCGTQWLTWWTDEKDQRMPACPDCVPGLAPRQQMTRR